ncbi:zinc finger protein 148 [Stomoxys calcitrans]|uniref:C2H2-type domain-containing protein n=1 Tax=Stomoxys calcitrans TaxID=35570 RepID=A0A1I8PW72_STOCA|nr:zinc finger protein 148 [Stomoxys calcitrans]
MMEMELIAGNVEHYTPPVDQLKPYKQFNCSQPDCNSTFTNQANYEMHLEKHHRLLVGQKSLNLRLFHCPELNCIYQFGKEKGKHFKNMKYLRQHYQKVHLSKNFVCEDCGKAFSLESQLRKHKKDVCGKKFACRECGWPYESLEALLTHGKRKGHNVKEVIMITKMDSAKATKDMRQVEKSNKPFEQDKLAGVKDSVMINNELNSTPALHLNPQSICSSQISAGVQTDCFSEMTDAATSQDLSNALDEIHSLLRDIETQTEPFLAAANENQNYLDQMLAQSSHMYTQTCDEFLSELGLADIQTQTHWPSPQRHVDDKLQFTSTATSTNCIHDELLVSTETQTSFTQCLLNSCSDTGTSTPPVSFGSLYHTSSQHTQTCDPLLESFDFGGQASDLIDGGFQSTYTQT